MQHLSSVYGSGRFGLSIEVFPPKTMEGDRALFETVQQLSRFTPAFVSCTYGAGGSTRDRTIDICRGVQEEHGITATAHFTCVGSSVEELTNWLDRASAAGIRNIMALRGDPPKGDDQFRAAAGGLSNANQLVKLIRDTHPELGIGVAGYPEKHLEAPDLDTDLRYLRQKVDAGANAVFTQLFFVNDSFLRFRDACTRLGITLPIVPGIMPITEYARIQRITKMCGAVFPTDLAARLEAVKDDLPAQFEIGVEHAIEQCQQLIDAGVPGIHFYALNKSQACERILDAISW
jgi:methylenetetrahydrofolate reductase (NADPH)